MCHSPSLPIGRACCKILLSWSKLFFRECEISESCNVRWSIGGSPGLRQLDWPIHQYRDDRKSAKGYNRPDAQYLFYSLDCHGLRTPMKSTNWKRPWKKLSWIKLILFWLLESRKKWTIFVVALAEKMNFFQAIWFILYQKSRCFSTMAN